MKIWMVTGAASGIGRHMVGRLAQQGAAVLATDLAAAALQSAAQAEGWPSERVITHPLEVRDPQGWQAAVELAVQQWDRLDGLIHCAGVIHPAYIPALTPAQIDSQIDVNVKGTIYGLHAAAQAMIPQKSGHIIVLGSLAGVAPIPGNAVYSASKFAVRGFALAAAFELRPLGVYVSVIAPDAVQTPMLDAQIPQDAAALTFSGGRVLTVEDIGQAIDQVMLSKGREFSIPRSRGWTAKIANLLPGVAVWLAPILTRRGQRQQQQRRK